MKFGIDVSFHKGFPDWAKAEGGIDFALMGVTERRGDDASFEHNYKGARSIGIPTGAYKYSYATSYEESKAEAKRIVEILNGRPMELGIFLDLEWETQKSYTMELRQDIIEGFRDVVEKYGYRFGIYCNRYWYETFIPGYAKAKYRFWIASYPMADNGTLVEHLKPNIPNLAGWQYSEAGNVKGFGNQGVDLDVWYEDVKRECAETIVIVPGTSADEIINLAESEIGKNQYDLSHKHIIDTYNAHSPLARGYKVTYTDSWCDTFVSYLFIKADAVDIIGGTECGVEEHVKKFSSAGIWIEDGAITPQPGDIIVFNWDKSAQPNDGYSDHIGIVERCEGGIVHTIEGNAGGRVQRRTYPVGHGNIRGYARPKYAGKTLQEAPERPETLSGGVGGVSYAQAPNMPQKAPYSLPELSVGSRGYYVKVLQDDLRGFWGQDLEVDGIFGPVTQKAVMAMQKKAGLVVDGIVGPQTWRAIQNRIAAELVLMGQYGNGEERKRRLADAGYDYQAVQNVVNELLK